MKKYCYILTLFISLLLLNSSSVHAQTAEQYVHLGNVSGRQDNYPQAIAYYTQAIETDPNLANAYYNRGFTYIRTRKYKLAITDLDKAIEIKPDYAAAYHVRGIAYFSRRKYDQAVADYDKAIGLEPDNVRYYISRMSANFKLGDNDKVWKDVIKIESLGGTVNPDIINMLKAKKYRDQ